MKFLYIAIIIFIGNINLFAQSPTPLTNFPQADYPVYAMALSSDGTTLYLGGAYTYITGTNGTYQRNGLASVELATGNITNWNPNPASTSIIYAMKLSSDGSTLYVGGNFTNINGSTRNRLASFNTSTGTLTAWAPTISDNEVQCIVLSSDGLTAYVGGNFTLSGENTRNCLASFLTSNGNLTAWDPDANGIVRSISITSNSIFVGGDFTAISTIAKSGLARFDASTEVLDQTWTADAFNSYGANIILNITQAGSYLYVNGLYTMIAGVPRNYCARLNLNGTIDSWNPATGGNAFGYSYVTGNDVYLGGSDLRRTDVDGNVYPWGVSFTDSLLGLAIISSIITTPTKIIVIGMFESAGGVSVNHIAAFEFNTHIPVLPDWGIILFSVLIACGGGYFILKRL